MSHWDFANGYCDRLKNRGDRLTEVKITVHQGEVISGYLKSDCLIEGDCLIRSHLIQFQL